MSNNTSNNPFGSNNTEYYSGSFSDIDARETTITGIEFDSCTFENCDLSESTFDKCRFIDCDFINCNLSLVRLGYSRFTDVSFTNSKMVGIDWTRADWPNIIVSAPISFRKCIINDSSFYGLNLTELKLEECKAHDVDFREGIFSGGLFGHTDFTNALFSSSNLESCSFIEATNYNIDINYNNIRHAKFTRYEAVRLLESLEIELVD